MCFMCKFKHKTYLDCSLHFFLSFLILVFWWCCSGALLGHRSDVTSTLSQAAGLQTVYIYVCVCKALIISIFLSSYSTLHFLPHLPTCLILSLFPVTLLLITLFIKISPYIFSFLFFSLSSSSLHLFISKCLSVWMQCLLSLWRCWDDSWRDGAMKGRRDRCTEQEISEERWRDIWCSLAGAAMSVVTICKHTHTYTRTVGKWTQGKSVPSQTEKINTTGDWFLLLRKCDSISLDKWYINDMCNLQRKMEGRRVGWRMSLRKTNFKSFNRNRHFEKYAKALSCRALDEKINTNLISIAIASSWLTFV